LEQPNSTSDEAVVGDRGLQGTGFIGGTVAEIHAAGFRRGWKTASGLAAGCERAVQTPEKVLVERKKRCRDQ
jgi:hypothetical protein